MPVVNVATGEQNRGKLAQRWRNGEGWRFLPRVMENDNLRQPLSTLKQKKVFSLLVCCEENPVEGCAVTHLKVHSKHNCYHLTPDQMQAIQDQGVSVKLEPGTNIVKIRAGVFRYTRNADTQAEPLVLLWIYGGKIINKKTNVAVDATWASLNGYDDALVMDVLEPAILCAFFFDTYVNDNEDEVTLSVVRV